MKTVKVLVAASMAAALLAGCGSKTDTDTFRFASELDIQGMDSTVVDMVCHTTQSTQSQTA